VFLFASFSLEINIVRSDEVIIVFAVEDKSHKYRLLFIQSKISGEMLFIISVSTQIAMA
jgi:hypothetical protein